MGEQNQGSLASEPRAEDQSLDELSQSVPVDISKNTVINEMKLVYASRPSLHPTLALMMVGLGSKMPCIFLKAGMTKRLQVTTADTGFPRTSTGTEGQRDKEEEAHEKTALQ